MTDKQISKSIMQRFYDLKAPLGYKLDYQWVKNHFKRKCKPEEFALIGIAIEELITTGKIVIDYEGETSLVLTKIGYEDIYRNVNKEVTIDNFRKGIMKRFKAQNSQVNHIIILDWLIDNLAIDFNPKEIESLPDAIDELIAIGYILKIEKNNFGISLTLPGYHHINM